ncbi:MAG: DUF1476 domain-containing protein [Pseudomonadota bacterium]
MSTFEDRQKGFEAKYAHDAEMQFKAEARRNKLLGIWAAEKMGLTGDDAERYAKEVIAADFEEAGDEDVYRKVSADLDAKSAGVSEEELRDQMHVLLGEAKAQLMEETD